ncbi:hypothetical protein Pst134EA_005633 [Puccinia striiformis f. sp. tritici]|uniref:hypothetical protein n=2 Tax=Puccinia striiformis f. sp. tritici TaxID=168172 RepID=UPI00200851D1|nr:hypothetical protein Pst134EA_005633 [Puccinia striiformis f. sp. tritici]KAH9471751.1 hypothetical protein Pst134EA_005633 [Puccinia striiformis f. sp. tritici]
MDVVNKFLDYLEQHGIPSIGAQNPQHNLTPSAHSSYNRLSQPGRLPTNNPAGSVGRAKQPFSLSIQPARRQSITTIPSLALAGIPNPAHPSHHPPNSTCSIDYNFPAFSALPATIQPDLTTSDLASRPPSAPRHSRSDSASSQLHSSIFNTPRSSLRSSRAPPSLQVTTPCSSSSSSRLKPSPSNALLSSSSPAAITHPSSSPAPLLLPPLRFDRPLSSPVHLTASPPFFSSLAHDIKSSTWRARRHSAITLNSTPYPAQPPPMTPSQSQSSTDHFAQKLSFTTSSADLQQSRPPLTLGRPIGGIGESPFRPKHTPHLSTSHVISTTLGNSRLFHKLPPRQHSVTQAFDPQPVIFNPASFNPSTFKKTHRKNVSEGQSLASNHHSFSIPRPRTPTSRQLKTPPLIGQAAVRRDHQGPPGTHSIVTGLGLAPISKSNHPSGLHTHYAPIGNPANSTSLHGATVLPGRTTEVLRSTSQTSSIPSLLNPSRVQPLPNDQPHTNQQAQQASSCETNTTQLVTEHHKDNQEKFEVVPSDQDIPTNYPLQNRTPRTPIPNRRAEFDAHSPQPPVQHSHPPAIAADDSQLHPPPPQHHGDANPSRQLTHPGFSFEPLGRSFSKYSLPRPRLDAKISQQCLDDRKARENGKNHKIPAIEAHIPFPRKISGATDDPSMEALKERYWNSKTDQLDAHQVWAEIYISRLERKLWKAEAEADISSDCLAFCMPFSSSSHAHHSHHSRRRVASASDAEPTWAGVGSSRCHDPNQSKSQRRGRFDFRGFHKASPNEKTSVKLIGRRPSSPLDISDGPLQRLPCISSSHFHSTGGITPYRPDLYSPNRHKPQSTLRSAASSRASRHDTRPNFPGSGSAELGYRIVLPTPDPKSHKSFRRLSRSVPDLRQLHRQLSSSPNSLNDTTGFSGDLSYKLPEFLSHADQSKALDLPTCPTTLSIPQSLIDAMFPPGSDSARNTPPYPPENLLSPDSISRHVHCVSSVKELHKSVYATIEAPDDIPTDSPDVLSESPEPQQPKGPLYSLPRFIEPRPAVAHALPPPPRKRNPTPAGSIHSTSQNSLIGAKRSTCETKRSTNESMGAHLSFVAPSERSCPSFPLPPSRRLTRRSCSPLTPPDHSPDPTAEDVASRYAQPSGPGFETPQRAFGRSISSVYPTSPTCESPVDSAYARSGFFSHISSRPCSLVATGPLVDHQDRPNSFYNQPPLSALFLASAAHNHQRRSDADAQVEHTSSHAKHVTRDSIDSSTSASSQSVIDPDKPINQADLFYQVPTSPRRNLIQDYDDEITRSRRALDQQGGDSTSTTVGKRSVLIDEILAEYSSPRTAKAKGPARPTLHPEELATAPAMDHTDQDRDETRSTESDSIAHHSDSSQPWSRSAAIHRIPRIVDAFEARQTSKSRSESHY